MKHPKSTPDRPQDIGPRPFGEFITEIADGDLERRLTSELAEVVRAVENTGKPGKLQVSIVVGTDGDMIRIVADTKLTLPKPPVAGTQFYKDHAGGLHTENPKQVKLWPSGAERNGNQVDLGIRPPAKSDRPRSLPYADDSDDPND